MFKPQAIFFDLDGLLLDTEPLHGQAWAKTAEILGSKLTTSQLILLRGQRRVECAKQLGIWLDQPVGVERILEVHQPISKKIVGNSQAMPGAEHLVSWCFKHSLPMALVSSSASESVAFKCSNHPWIDLMKTKVLGDDILLKAGKPSPYPFLLAAKKLKVDPKKCWVFEDSLAGEKSALDAGCQVLILVEKNSSKAIKIDSSDWMNPLYISNLANAIERLEKLL